MYSDIRLKNLCANWEVLLNEACSDALLAYQEQDVEYAATLQRQQEALTRLCKLAEGFETEALRKEFDMRLHEVIGAGTQAQQACYLAGAGDGLRLAQELGLLKL